MTAGGPGGSPVSIAVAGDVMLGRQVNEVINSRWFAYPWGDMLGLLSRADLLLVNLECTLTSETRAAPDGTNKAFHFRADPSVVETLRLAGVDCVSLANNHADDFGAAGLLETIRVLDGAGIQHAGAGADREQARRPALLSADGWRVTVVAFADYPAEWAASEPPGINYVPVSTAQDQFHAIESAIAAARAQADFVVFSIHWGPNMRLRPPPPFQQFARAVIDAGADIFWGHSAHVVQGVELWNGKPILYDTGDFVDDYAVDFELRNDLSALFVLDVRPPAVRRIEIVPVKIDDMQVNRARGDDRAWFIERFTELCSEMGTELETADGALSIQVPQPVGEAS